MKILICLAFSVNSREIDSMFHFSFCCHISSDIRPPLAAQAIKNLPAMRETQVGSLDQEDRLEEEMATHSSILAWRIPWTEEAGGLQSIGTQRVGHD